MVGVTANCDAVERRNDDDAGRVIISGRAEGADMPTGKTRSRCAWEAVNAPAIRCPHTQFSGHATGNTNLAKGGSNDA